MSRGLFICVMVNIKCVITGAVTAPAPLGYNRRETLFCNRRETLFCMFVFPSVFFASVKCHIQPNGGGVFIRSS